MPYIAITLSFYSREVATLHGIVVVVVDSLRDNGEPSILNYVRCCTYRGLYFNLLEYSYLLILWGAFSFLSYSSSPLFDPRTFCPIEELNTSYFLLDQ